MRCHIHVIDENEQLQELLIAACYIYLALNIFAQLVTQINSLLNVVGQHVRINVTTQSA